MQSAVPVVALYVGDGHALQAIPSSSAVYPATHLQAVTALLPSADMVCEGQSAQKVDPAIALYVPVAHGVHFSGSATSIYSHTTHVLQTLSLASIPMLQTQSANLLLPA